MSFLADPPILYAAGEAYARAVPESGQGRAAAVAGAGVVGTCLAVSVSLWLNASWTRPLWKAFGARSGREFQVANGIVDVPAVRKPEAGAHALAAVGFAAYPLWFWLGWDHGRRRR